MIKESKCTAFLRYAKEMGVYYDNTQGCLFRRKKKLNQFRVIDIAPTPMCAPCSSRYKRVHFTVDSVKYVIYEHVAIKVLFDGIENVRKGLIVDHIDGNRLNNHVNNLEWVTIEENNRRAKEVQFLLKTGEDNAATELTTEDVKAMRDIFMYGFTSISALEISRVFGISHAATCRILKGETWKDLITREYAQFIETQELVRKLPSYPKKRIRSIYKERLCRSELNAVIIEAY